MRKAQHQAEDPDEHLTLARDIGNCSQVFAALDDETHPCAKVVRTQGSLLNPRLRQRPEPWFGNLAAAKVLFISSNPSINEDEGPLCEVFPTFEWTPERSADFFVNRITRRRDSFVTFGHAAEPNFLTRCLDGEYRSGTKSPKRPQPTWRNTHKRAVELLGDEADPRRNYAITEVVHCKSKGAVGVPAAASHCSAIWMGHILRASAANVVVLLGSHVRDNFAIPVLGAPSDFGASKGYKAMTPEARRDRDIMVSSYGGRDRVYVFNWHPVAMALKRLPDVYGPQTVEWLRNIANGR